MIKKIGIGICILGISVFTLASQVFCQSWPNLLRGNTLVKDGQLRVVDDKITVDQELILDGAMKYGTDTVTMSAETPNGHGTITASATEEISHYVITDATGAGADILDLEAGVLTGQQIRITLASDLETTGLNVVPSTKLIGTSTLFEDAGDTATYEWTGSAWHVVNNIGGTEQ